MDPQTRSKVVDRIQEIGRELGLLEPEDLTSWKPASEQDLQDIEELYSERERLLQELKRSD